MASIGGLSFYEFKSLMEDKVKIIVDSMTDAEILIAYKYMRNKCGISMQNIDNKTDELVRKEHLAGNI